MDKKTATEFVERIEAHREEEQAIWDEMRDLPDYEMHEDKTIKGILDARKRARDLMEEAEADLGAFDWVDDGTGNFVPREEAPAWPVMSAKLREVFADDPKAMKMVDQIDKLHALAEEKGLPAVTMADFEAELEKASD